MPINKKENKIFEEYAQLLYNFKEIELHCEIVTDYEDKLCKIVNKIYKII